MYSQAEPTSCNQKELGSSSPPSPPSPLWMGGTETTSWAFPVGESNPIGASDCGCPSPSILRPPCRLRCDRPRSLSPSSGCQLDCGPEIPLGGFLGLSNVSRPCLLRRSGPQ